MLYFYFMINFFMFYHYVKHNFKANSRHGIHSPFVFKLIDTIIYDFKDKKDYPLIEELREKLLQDERKIKVLDLGAGSKLNNDWYKKIKDIASNALKSKRLAQLMYRFVTYFKPKTILEFGTCLGVTTSYMAKAYPQAQIVTMEGCPETAKVAKENFNTQSLTNVEILVGDFKDSMPKAFEKSPQVDFAFIDGNHQKLATVDYFNQLLPYTTEKSVLIFDDIYWSKEMYEAWEIIKSDPNVTITIDLFWIGLVFFKTDQVKEHFKVRF